MNTISVDVVIIGAGISGLSAAVFARKRGLSVMVLEETNRPGGVIHTDHKDGYLLEYGPNTVLPNADIMELIETAGLKDQVLLADSKSPRFIYFNGTLHQVPMSPPALIKSKLLSPMGKFRILLEPFIPPKKNGTDETLISFARRRLGREAAERLVSTYVSGVWAGDAEKLSAASSFPKLANLEKEHGSLLWGAIKEILTAGRRAGILPGVHVQDSRPPAGDAVFHGNDGSTRTTKPPKGLLSLKQGLEHLPRAIAHWLGNDIAFNVTSIEIVPPQTTMEGIWKLKTNRGDFEATHVILAETARKAGGLIEPFAKEASKALASIPYIPLAAYYCSTPKDASLKTIQGFGFLVVPKEKSNLLGCLFNSCLFPDRSPEGQHLFTVFIGGATNVEILRNPDSELIRLANQDVRSILGLKNDPHPIALMRYDQAIPQYNVGHGEKLRIVQQAEKDWPGLNFAGNYLEGISVGDVVNYSRKVIDNLNRQPAFPHQGSKVLVP
ncbi:MAG: protoporphyrinogen oxidase [Elusimicrobia bacterium]|nr:protoporphyrinogen oxidase [Candidatus Obscuribacterium magneticum]